MNPGRYDLDIIQGADFEIAVEWLIDDVAVDLSGYQARAEIRKKPGGELLYTFKPEGDPEGELIIEGTSLTLQAPNDSLNDATWRSAHWDLKLYAEDETETRLLEGKATLSPATTQDAP